MLPGHPEPAVSCGAAGSGRGAHARPKATRVHHPARRRGGRVAACGAWATVSNADCGKTQPVRPALFLIGPMTAVSAAKLRGTLASVTQRDGRSIVPRRPAGTRALPARLDAR